MSEARTAVGIQLQISSTPGSTEHPWQVQPVIRRGFFLEVRRWYPSPGFIRSAALLA